MSATQTSLNGIELARSMIACDSRPSVSNVPLLELIQRHLSGWQLERVDYVDEGGVPKGNLVARWPTSTSRLAFAGHLDTVTDAGWTTDPFAADLEGDEMVGLGAVDMKGPISAMLAAATGLPHDCRPLIVLTADEESTKRGVREVLGRSETLREFRPHCFIVGEPTNFRLVRGHRVDVQFVVTACGRQAHSSTGKGLNANIQLIPFLSELRRLHLRLREDTTLHDRQYDPPFCDLNFTIENYGTLPNTTVGLATCKIKLRYSKSFDPQFVIDELSKMAEASGLDLVMQREAPPPELSADAPLVRAVEAIIGDTATVVGFGTEASEYTRLAPSLVLGPGCVDQAHKPGERIPIGDIRRAQVLYSELAQRLNRKLPVESAHER
ncbi:acetylornithine deacetylase [Bradyrhizobium sp. CIR48]|uniref:M20/M25/M40 family metallo-hydrolase n=1 Tax=Bradyrhizobium sp. CIR48 TaxID=2663840 RepID=UPI0016058035|nr:M20/M25/M40 family metallo-hydrolase [Bradyrhizobium sp. CIR48]MBB4427579.1 acetylornithine deacetylase [Bradyrhizobium sp. CIR48]